MLKERLVPYVKFSYLFLVMAAFFGLLYALQLLGFGIDLIRPDLTRSLHISLMLYGFIPLMMSLLPFALFDKDGVINEKAIASLERFLWLWTIFLVFMIFSILAGATRGLPFYDFAYELNFLLAMAGIFYITAIFKSIAHYEKKPLWVQVSLVAVIVSPIALLVLMHPKYGQVEKMLMGPHGDNTLGMSFALVVIYYLAVKLASPNPAFKTRWHLLWIVPLAGYIGSVLYRSFIGSLSYDAEWFLQYLTLFYIPLFVVWWKDAKLSIKKHLTLFISMAAFLFADAEGNILFIPHLRALFHRNDLVVGHAHVAVGIGLLFLALSIIEPFVKISIKRALYLTMTLCMMALVLSISGFAQAGFLPMHIETMWALRALFGLFFIVGLLYRLPVHFLRRMRSVDWYNMAGFLSDGISGFVLVLFGGWLYSFIAQDYAPGYQQVVFGFVMGVGCMHLLGLLFFRYAHAMAQATVIVRTLTAAGFFALYKVGVLGWIALVIALVDFFFVLVYLFKVKDQARLCRVEAV
ncbi:hypothetical protein [Hydrogenimonas urashimensis]|uniref:hypothetical protein n=1 Tax=Hydrogenimonas urashimensis TaxID=2740515 RepID=UPI001915F6A3|nr:hypothetical protein [Hydrogenimonas urashimensis]